VVAHKLDVDGGVAERGEYGRAALTFAVENAATVDVVVRDAIAAGATVTRQPGDKPFGYSGVFADLDGRTWEVAWVRG
jgi:predicted lactoylglutathione lyase